MKFLKYIEEINKFQLYLKICKTNEETLCQSHSSLDVSGKNNLIPRLLNGSIFKSAIM